MSRYFMGNTFDEATSLMPNNGRARLIGSASAGHACELTFADMNLANASHKKGMFTGTGDVNSRAQFLTRRGIGTLAKHRTSDSTLTSLVRGNH